MPPGSQYRAVEARTLRLGTKTSSGVDIPVRLFPFLTSDFSSNEEIAMRKYITDCDRTEASRQDVPTTEACPAMAGPTGSVIDCIDLSGP